MIERDVKARVKEIIAQLDPTAHVFMPVQTGFGAADLDFVVTVQGWALRIETKVDGKQPSARQRLTIASLVKAGAIVLILDQFNLRDLVLVIQSIHCDQSRERLGARLIAADSRELYCEK